MLCSNGPFCIGRPWRGFVTLNDCGCHVTAVEGACRGPVQLPSSHRALTAIWRWMGVSTGSWAARVSSVLSAAFAFSNWCEQVMHFISGWVIRRRHRFLHVCFLKWSNYLSMHQSFKTIGLFLKQKRHYLFSISHDCKLMRKYIQKQCN